MLLSKFIFNSLGLIFVINGQNYKESEEMQCKWMDVFKLSISFEVKRSKVFVWKSILYATWLKKRFCYYKA